MANRKHVYRLVYSLLWPVDTEHSIKIDRRITAMKRKLVLNSGLKHFLRATPELSIPAERSV